MRSRTAVLAAISAGLALASSCFPLLAQSVRALGPWSIAAVLGCGGLVWLVSRVFAELAGAFPTSAGVRTYVGQAYGPRAGLALALLYLFLVVALGASETYVLSEVLARVLPGLPAVPVTLGFVALCALANVIGFELAGRVQAVLTAGLFGGLLVVCGGALAGAPTTTPVAPTGLSALAVGVPSAAFLFVGFEWVVSAVEEGDARALPRAMTWSVALMTAVYSALALALAHGLGASELGGSTQHVALGQHAFGRAGALALAGLSTAATVTSFNGGILGASRLVYALGREGVLPRKLATLHPRFFTPWVAILVMSLITGASALTLASAKTFQVPVLTGAAIECLAYAACALAFAKLRSAQPQRARPYLAPFGPWMARGLAVVFGALAVGCVVAAEEWKWATGGCLGGSMLVAGMWAFTRRVPAPKKQAAPKTLFSREDAKVRSEREGALGA